MRVLQPATSQAESQCEVFIGDVDDPEKNSEEYAVDWAIGICPNPETVRGTNGVDSARRASRRGKAVKQMVHDGVRDQTRTEVCSVCEDTVFHVHISTPELRLRNTGVG